MFLWSFRDLVFNKLLYTFWNVILEFIFVIHILKVMFKLTLRHPTWTDLTKVMWSLCRTFLILFKLIFSFRYISCFVLELHYLFCNCLYLYLRWSLKWYCGWHACYQVETIKLGLTLACSDHSILRWNCCLWETWQTGESHLWITSCCNWSWHTTVKGELHQSNCKFDRLQQWSS